MNVLLLCAAGYSSSMIVNDLKKYCMSNQLNYTFTAKMAVNFEELLEDESYDLILMAPQISYKFDEIKKMTDIPIVEINYMDYALCNARNIVSLVEKALN